MNANGHVTLSKGCPKDAAVRTKQIHCETQTDAIKSCTKGNDTRELERLMTLTKSGLLIGSLKCAANEYSADPQLATFQFYMNEQSKMSDIRIISNL